MIETGHSLQLDLIHLSLGGLFSRMFKKESLYGIMMLFLLQALKWVVTITVSHACLHRFEGAHSKAKTRARFRSWSFFVILSLGQTLLEYKLKLPCIIDG